MRSFIQIIVLGALAWLVLSLLNTATRSSRSLGTPSGPPITFLTDANAALSQARTSGKPAVLVFSASWCPPCQQMKKEVYPSAEVTALRSDFVWAYLDLDEPANRPIAQRFGVQGIPHIQFVSADGRPLGKQVGAISAPEFAAELKDLLSSAP